MPPEGNIAKSPDLLSLTLEADGFASSSAPSLEGWSISPEDAQYNKLFCQIDESWRAGGTHLSRSRSGLWYMRFKVPEAIRAAYPDLPKELRRSTKTRHKIHALAISRKMCLDFLIRHRISETRMGQPEKSTEEQTQALQPQYSFTVVNGSVRLHFSGSPALETLQEATRCFQALQSALVANDPSFALNLVATPDPATSPLGAAAVSEEPAADLSPADASPFSSPLEPCANEDSGKEQDHSTPALSSTDTPQWLSEAIDRWYGNGAHTFTANTWKHSYAPSFRILREIIGTERHNRVLEDGSVQSDILDIRMSDITDRHIHILHDCLKQLPPNQGSNTAVVEALTRIQQRQHKRQPLPSASNVEKKLGHLLPFFRYAKEAKWIQADVLDAMHLIQRTASAQLSKALRKKGGKAGYVALSKTELARLFSHENLIQDSHRNPWKFWVPLLCLHQGVRVSETSQLYTNDIQFIDGIPCISVIEDTQDETASHSTRPQAKSSEEYRRLKTLSSRRVIPLHPQLIKLGFLQFVEQIQQRNPRRATHLFANLPWDEKSMFGRKPARFVIELLKELQIHVPRNKVAHSLRSNFNQELQRTMIPSALISRMLGHSTRQTKDEHYNEADYGPALPFAEILPFLSQMDFGLTLPRWDEIMRKKAALRLSQQRGVCPSEAGP